MVGSTLLKVVLPSMAATWLAVPAASAPVQDPGTVLGEQKIAWSSGSFGGVLDNRDRFGRAMAALGDLDGDGVTDLAVGAHEDDDGGSARGAVWILFMNADGTVRTETKIGSGTGGFLGALGNFDHFGVALAALDDLDGDGLAELAVGAEQDDDGGPNRGAVWILHLDGTGQVTSEQKISQTAGGFAGALVDGDRFGRSVTRLGDLDGDGVADLAVGADQTDDGGPNRGAVWILFMNADGTVRDQAKISGTQGGFTGVLDNDDRFGASVAALGDVDGDGVVDLAVGADQDDDGASAAGAVWVLFLEPAGTVKIQTKIGAGLGLALTAFDRFGGAVACPGDLDGDGVVDLAVGATGDDDAGVNRGAAWIVFLDDLGGVRGWQKISSSEGNFGGPLLNSSGFGSSVAGLSDFDGDGKLDLAVGADADDEGGSDRGAVWVLLLEGEVMQQVNSPPIVEECSGAGTYELGVATVVLGGVVSDPDGDHLSFSWSLDGEVLVKSSLQAPTGTLLELPDLKLTTGTDPAADLGAGQHVLLLEVSDGTAEPVACEVLVDVVDTLAPTLTATSNRSHIWPPNRRMVDIVIETNAEDASGGPVSLAATVSSNDPSNGWFSKRRGPDFTEPVIDPESGAIRLQVRAQRSRWGRPRVYTVSITGTDAVGNQAATTVEITVARDRGGKDPWRPVWDRWNDLLDRLKDRLDRWLKWKHGGR